MMTIFLLVPENSNVSATDEVKHIISWYDRNKLKINLSRELVFKRPNLKHEILPCTLPDVIRVKTVKLLGVYIDHTMSSHEHHEQIARICNKKFFCCNRCVNND